LAAITEESDARAATAHLAAVPSSSLFNIVDAKGAAPVAAHRRVDVREDPAVKQRRKAKGKVFAAALAAKPSTQSRRAPPQLADAWADPDAVARKARKVATRSRRTIPAQVPALPLPLPGSSYNPTAADHADALVMLAEAQARVRSASKAKTPLPSNNDNNAAARDETASSSSSSSSDDDDEPAKRPAKTVAKTRADRARESLHRQRMADVAQRKQARAQAAQVHALAHTVAEVDAEDAKRAAEREEARQRKATKEASTPVVRVNGRVWRPSARTVLLPEVVAPEQLPGSLRAIPGVPGVVDEHVRHMQGRNLIEAGRPQLRGIRRKARLHKRGQRALDLEDHARRVPEPHFAAPRHSEGAYKRRKR